MREDAFLTTTKKKEKENKREKMHGVWNHHKVLFSSHSINPVNAKKMSHRMFRHIYGVLSKPYLQNFLYGWAVNRETNLMSLLNL